MIARKQITFTLRLVEKVSEPQLCNNLFVGKCLANQCNDGVNGVNYVQEAKVKKWWSKKE